MQHIWFVFYTAGKIKREDYEETLAKSAANEGTGYEIVRDLRRRK